MLLSSPPKEYKILEESTFADSIIKKINGGSREVYLVIKQVKYCQLLKVYNEIQNYEDGVPVQIRIITSLDTLYKVLSVYGPGALKESHAKHVTYNIIRFTIVKIGQTTGDMLIIIEGKPELALDILELIIKKNSQPQELFYYISILISTDNLIELPNNEYGVKFDCGKTAYGLAPGILLTISSQDIKLISQWVIQLSIDHFITKSCLDQLKHRGPPILKSTRLHESIGNQEPTNNDVKTSEFTQHKVELVELTKREITYIIGKKGRRIEDIRKLTNAIVKVVPLSKENQSLFRDPLASQFLRISGHIDLVNKALQIVESDIYQFRSNGIITYS